ncbi:MAG: hypothetical protein HFI63_08705 [Lachnospiraceae bacterium]|nr:hypothetical protein [Lachnospiraceae bacterium]
MKNHFKYLRIGFLLLSVLFFVGGRTAFAAEEEYTYTVRLYAGNQGALTGGGVEVDSDSADIVSDGDQLVITGLRYGDLVSIRPQDAAASTDARYHVRGVRRSGRDNSEAEAPAFYVGSDRDFVVAYAVSGGMAAYRVEYVDTNGVEIMKSDTYYGNVGEREYVSSRYIEGYQPQALNMVQTLSANEAENVFTFVYTPIQTPTESEPAPSPTPTPAEPEAPSPEASEEAGRQIEDEEVPLGGDTNASQRDNRQQQGLLPNRQIGNEKVPRASGQEFLKDKDIDDEEVPLGNYKDERKNTVMGYLPIYIGIGTAAVAALAVAAVFLRKRRKTVEAESIEAIGAAHKKPSRRRK